jgi:hypothetical protein
VHLELVSMTHAPVYMRQQYPGGPGCCGVTSGVIRDIGHDPPTDCPACLQILAEEDAAWMTRRRKAAEQERAMTALAVALFGWAA